MERTESAYGNRYCFQGREIDWTTGLMYFRARWYDPGTGRWLSKDPVGIAGGLNQYEFCESNPVMFVDPTGLDGHSSTAPDVGTAVVGYGFSVWRGYAVGAGALIGSLASLGWGIAITIIVIKVGDLRDGNSDEEDSYPDVDGVTHG